MINFTSDSNYLNNLYDRLVLLEGSVAKLYLDSRPTDKHPTIGLGFDLRVLSSFTAVVNVLAPTMTTSQRTTLQSIINQTYTNNSTLQTAVNNQMQVFHNQDSAIPATFEFSSNTDPRIKEAWINILPEYEQRVDNWLSGIPVDATEREVFVSLAYNGLINTGTSPSLRAAIINGNRAEAWYEIRYDSNGDNQHSNRRYLESYDFKLFKEITATQNEAHQAAIMYTAHKDSILNYENLYNPTTSTYHSYGIKMLVRAMIPLLGALMPILLTAVMVMIQFLMLVPMQP